MTSPQSAINQRSFLNQQRRQSKITVEYHRPSRESIQEYNALLAESNLHAAEAAKYSAFTPSRQAPAPPQPLSSRSKTPPDTPLSPTSSRIRNSLQKPNPRARKHSLTSVTPTPRITEHDPFAANATTNDPLAHISRNGMAGSTSPPPRPSRANTATLHDIFPAPSALAARRLSSPPEAPVRAVNDDSQFYADPSEALPSGPSSEYTNSSNATPIHTPTLGNRSRSGTTVKSKKGVLGFMSEVFNSTKRPEISTPYDPVHLTHVGFNSSTGEFTGLPKEWQQLLQESGISRSDQEKNPQAVMEIVKFYQEGRGDVWDKLGAMGGATDLAYRASNIDDTLQNPVRSKSAFPAYSLYLSQQRSPPPPPKPKSQYSQSTTNISAPVAYRPAPTPPNALTPSLDRSTSQRTPAKPSKSIDGLGRANTTRDRRSPGPTAPGQAGGHAAANQEKVSSKPSPGSSSTELPLKQPQPGPSSGPAARAAETRAPNQQQPSPAVSSLAKASGVATPRRREKKVDKGKEEDIVKRLKQICTDADPTRLYRNLVKIGQG